MTITTRSPGAAGCLFVVAAPSGGGKSSMVNALLEREPGIRLSISYTTRPPRPGEAEGQHYHFVDVAHFLTLKERLEKRAQDPPAVIEQRLIAARDEMRHCGEFDYVIMNQDFARAVDDLSAIVRAARLTAARQQIRHAKALAQLLSSDF
jgi:guanylate kinase